MSFSLVNTWAVGDQLTSAQINQLAGYVADALDKSTAGDSIAGTVTFTGAGKIRTSSSDQIEVANGNGLIVSASSGIVTTGSGSITSTTASGINTAVAGGIVPLVAGGITDGGVTHGIKATVQNGIEGTASGSICPTVAGGISDGGVSGGILITASHGLETFSLGSIFLNAGASDWLRYGTTRSVTRNLPLGMTYATATGAIGTGWSMAFASGVMALVGAATANSIQVPLNGMFSGVVNGATLTSLSLVFAVGQSHTGVPSTMPSLNVFRQATAAGQSVNATSLYSGGPQSIPSGGLTGSTWYSSGNIQQFATTPDQNNAIDTSNYIYFLQLTDEQSTNSQTGNMYFSLLCTFSGISNSAPG